jgi:hypothetical protein
MNILIVILICLAWFLSGALVANHFWNKSFGEDRNTSERVSRLFSDFMAGILGPIGALASYLLYRYV